MHPSQLFQAEVEPILRTWINEFEHAHQIVANIQQLFSNLKETAILGELDEHVSISGPVHVGKGSKIHPFVRIEGPVIIGEGVSVRPHSNIRNHAYIGSNAVVGHGADIKRSVCLNESKIQDSTFVGDSVVGFAGRIGSGAVLANRKFDQTEILVREEDGTSVSTGLEFLGSIVGDFARIGANCSLSPGTIVGQHTWVGSGAVIHGTIEPDLLILVEQTLKVKQKSKVQLRSGRGEYESI